MIQDISFRAMKICFPLKNEEKKRHKNYVLQQHNKYNKKFLSFLQCLCSSQSLALKRNKLISS